MKNEPARNLIRYLNTDLELASSAALDALIAELEARNVNALYPAQQGNDGRWHVHFEVDYPGEWEEGHTRSPETTITLILDAIESLSAAGRSLFETCTHRKLDIGFDCGDEPWAYQQSLSHQTVQRMAAAGIALGLTLYPPRPSNDIVADSTENEPDADSGEQSSGTSS